jgi:hypothetical protein
MELAALGHLKRNQCGFSGGFLAQASLISESVGDASR